MVAQAVSLLKQFNSPFPVINTSRAEKDLNPSDVDACAIF
jgi:hypothetical protein